MEMGFENNRSRDDCALLLSPTKVTWIFIEQLLLGCQSHLPHNSQHSVPNLSIIRCKPMNRQRMTYRAANCHRRVQRGMRVLEDDLHSPSERSHACFFC